MYLNIATVDKTLFKGEVYSITCPGGEGELTILAHHMPIITILKSGVVNMHQKKDSEVQSFKIEHGLLEVGDNRATILL